MFFPIVLSLIFVITLGCGVKGKPLPPETPREIGIGKPQYKGVDEEMKPQQTKKEDSQDKESDQKEKK